MVRSHCWFTLSSHFMMKSKLMVTRERSWLQRLNSFSFNPQNKWWKVMRSEKMQTYSVRLKQERMKSNIYQMCLEKLHPWAHSAFPLRKHRFVQWMSLYSKTAFTSNFQTKADEIWSSPQDSHLPSTTPICLLRAHIGIRFPDHPSTAAPVCEQDYMPTGFLKEQGRRTKKELCLLRQKCTLWAMIAKWDGRLNKWDLG